MHSCTKTFIQTHLDIFSNTLHAFKHFASNFNQSITKTKTNAFKHQNIYLNTLRYFFKHLAYNNKQVTKQQHPFKSITQNQKINHSNQLSKIKNRPLLFIYKLSPNNKLSYLKPLYMNQTKWSALTFIGSQKMWVGNGL